MHSVITETTRTMEQKHRPLLAFTTYNKVGMTMKCMEYASELGYDILVVDDCSVDGTQEYLSQIKVNAILKSERRGLTDSWNRAYKYFIGSDYTHLILCNNDVLIPRGAIEGMLSDYWLVVPMCNRDGSGYVCDKQFIGKYYQVAVFKTDSDKSTDMMQQWLTDSGPRGLKPISCWTGFCMCLHRDIAFHARPDGNLFDPTNINVGNDDYLGKKVPAFVSLDSYVYHYKGHSFNGQISNRDDLQRDYK